MTLEEIARELGLRTLTSVELGGTEVTGGFTCDLLSNVMAHGQEGDLWITMQTHENILAVAGIKDLAGIVVVEGRLPQDETIRKAEEEDVVILGTDESAFRLSGRLYRLIEDH